MAANPPLHLQVPVKPFRLTRFFSLASLIGTVIVTICLFLTYRELSIRQLVEHEGRANADLTRAFANSMWDDYRGFIMSAGGRTRGELIADPVFPRLHNEVRIKMAGTKVAKVKIYHRSGLTVFSTDDKQVGEDKSGNAGFRGALAGKTVSQIVFREKFDSFEGVISNRNLIFSYIPVRPAADGTPEGVFEVYSDVTDLLAVEEKAQWQVAGVVLALLTTLYLFLFSVVRKADAIISRQEQEREAQAQEVRHLAYHDVLTGLPNRAYFGERLGETISMASRKGVSCALLFVDLDRFKLVNDSLGHAAGDALLVEVARRIRANLRNSDLLFRMGGDEFTIILQDVVPPEDAAHVADRVLDAVGQSISIHEHEVSVDASIGIAVFPGDGDSADELLKHADAAMYSAKESGRGNYAFFRRDMNRRAVNRLGLEAALKKAHRDNEFVLHYQPRYDTKQRCIVALEALLRWQNPERGLVAPGEFIGILEESGMMNRVGEWVLRTACAQARRWHEGGDGALRISVNVSAVQFRNPAFVGVVRDVIAETGIDANLVELELTESMLISNMEQTRATIAALKALGVRIAIDDFGTGYSSLNYLRHFDVDYLKIDKSFVTGIEGGVRDQQVAIAIGELARALQITVVAEGIETELQAQFFSNIHCGEFQGFLFSRPVTGEQVSAILHGDPAGLA